MLKFIKHPRHYLNGDRGTLALTLATAFMFIGSTYVFLPESASRREGIGWIPFGIGAFEVGLVWILSSAIAIGLAFIASKCDRADNAVFTILSIPPMLLAAIFAVSIFVNENWHGVTTVISYTLWAVIVQRVARSVPGRSHGDSATIGKIKTGEIPTLGERDGH